MMANMPQRHRMTSYNLIDEREVLDDFERRDSPADIKKECRTTIKFNRRYVLISHF